METTLETSGELDAPNFRKISVPGKMSVLAVKVTVIRVKLLGSAGSKTMEESVMNFLPPGINKITLETSGKDQKLHSKRVYFSPIAGVVFIGSGSISVTLDSMVNMPSFSVNFSGKLVFSTRFECVFRSFPLVSSVFCDLLHSFRV